VTFSITRRLLVSSLIVLSAFLGLAGIALDRAFLRSVESAARDQLQAHVYTLLTAAEADLRGRMRLPQLLATPAFNQPDSGLYAEVHGEDGSYRWRSASLLGRDLGVVQTVSAGITRFRTTDIMIVIDQAILWEDNEGRPIDYTLSVARDRQPLNQQQAVFRSTLWQWLGGVAAVLLLAMLGLIRWGLRPLNAMSETVRRLESGDSTRIEGPVPRELQGLSDNLNALITLSAKRQARVRNSLADLAHSMKTPLAVLRAAAEQSDDQALNAAVQSQTARIDQIVTYQRQRAAVAGGSAITRAVKLQPILSRLCASLEKVHRDRDIAYTLEADEELRLRADEGDLFELFGNLLENAYRHARHRVVVTCRSATKQLLIEIDDDGEGIDPGDAERLLKRGERADQQHPGEGIGLAVVSEIVSQYGGEVSIARAAMGGARVRLIFPA
jgi:two-component system sensor histidine kinase PhoQ